MKPVPIKLVGFLSKAVTAMLTETMVYVQSMDRWYYIKSVHDDGSLTLWCPKLNMERKELVRAVEFPWSTEATERPVYINWLHLAEIETAMQARERKLLADLKQCDRGSGGGQTPVNKDKINEAIHRNRSTLLKIGSEYEGL